MNQFSGKICPYCKTEFVDDDDIVVCSECNMPHHKECWIENQGCTTFGCSGTIQNSDSVQEPDSQANKVPESDIEMNPSNGEHHATYCPSCGRRRKPSDLFCGYCGCRFTDRADGQAQPSSADEKGFIPSSAQTNSSHTEEDNYIDQNYDYYKENFNYMRNQDKKITWNWAAFFLAPYWSIYRKMYGVGAAVIGGTFLLSLFGIWGNVISFAGHIVFGLFANYIYMTRIQNLVIEEQSLQGENRMKFNRRNSGTNTAAAILTVVGFWLLVTYIYRLH